MTSLNVTCIVCIDCSINTDLDVKTNVERIVMGTQSGVTLNALSLETTTVGIDINARYTP